MFEDSSEREEAPLPPVGHPSRAHPPKEEGCPKCPSGHLPSRTVVRCETARTVGIKGWGGVESSNACQEIQADRVQACKGVEGDSSAGIGNRSAD